MYDFVSLNICAAYMNNSSIFPNQVKGNAISFSVMLQYGFKSIRYVLVFVGFGKVYKGLARFTKVV